MILGQHCITLRELINWLNEQNITREDIISLFEAEGGYLVVYEIPGKVVYSRQDNNDNE